MGEGPLTGAWPQLLALGRVPSSTPEEEESAVGDLLRKRQGRWQVEWEKQGREGEEAPRAVVWGRALEGSCSLIPKENLGGAGLPLARSGVEPLHRSGKGRKEGTN